MTFRSMHPQFNASFQYFECVPIDFREALWNYFAYGIDPGSFGMAVLMNDFIEAMCSAHPALNDHTFRDLAKWLLHCAPNNSYGSIDAINLWKLKTDDERRDIMIEYNLRPSEFDILKGIADR